MAKKLFAFFLVAVLLCGSLCACQNDPTSTKEPDGNMNTTSKYDPTTDDTLKILMVGNSFCYYYVEELYGLLMANTDPNRGYSAVEIFNLYYSGCSLTQHMDWWKNDTGKYQLFKTDARGRVEMEPSKQWTLENALVQGNWDYISLQGSSTGFSYAGSLDKEGDELAEYCAAMTTLAEPLLARFHKLHPKAKLLWHRTWAFEVGRISGSTVYDEAMLTRYNAGIQKVSDYMCSEFVKDKSYDLIMVNSGAAWAEARAMDAQKETTLFPDGGLCARLGVSNAKTYMGAQNGEPNVGDGYHDGDIGGGQYLNACVWYETLTGQSCIDNSYRPSYANGRHTLSEEMITLLQNAAHTAVQSMKAQ